MDLQLHFFNLETIYYPALVPRQKYLLDKALHLTFEIPSGVTVAMPSQHSPKQGK